MARWPFRRAGSGSGPDGGPVPRRRRPLRLLAVLAVQVVVALLLLEGGLRLLRPHHRGSRALLYRATVDTDLAGVDSLPQLLEASPVGWRPCAEEHGYVLSSRSFRTGEYEEAKPRGVYRVLLLGDSFTYGVVPQADHWGRRLAAGLETPLAPGEPEVVNLGVPGTGTPFQLRLWQLEGRRLAPDLVVLGFFVGNDFFDELGNRPGWRGLSERLALASHAYRALRNLLRLGRSGRALAAAPSATPAVPREGGCGHELAGFGAGFRDDRPTMPEALYSRIEAERMSLLLAGERWKLDLRIARVASLLERFAREVEGSGARFVVLLIPDEAQVDPAVRAAAAEHAGRSPDAYDVDLPQRLLVRYLEEHAVEHLDLLPAFLRQAGGEPLYILRDSHWNRAGNRLAAEVLLEYLGG